jgi:hypothetical protein
MKKKNKEKIIIKIVRGILFPFVYVNETMKMINELKETEN